MTQTEEKITGLIYAVFIGFLAGMLLTIFLCKKMPERYGITPRETQCGCNCSCCAEGGKQE